MLQLPRRVALAHAAWRNAYAIVLMIHVAFIICVVTNIGAYMIFASLMVPEKLHVAVGAEAAYRFAGSRRVVTDAWSLPRVCCCLPAAAWLMLRAC